MRIHHALATLTTILALTTGALADESPTCAATRPDRIEDGRAWLNGHLTRLRKTLPLMKGKGCKVIDVPTGAWIHDRNRTYPEMRWDVACKGGIPKGTSKDDVYFVLTARNLDDVEVMSESEYKAENEQCLASDREVGFDTRVKFGSPAKDLAHLMSLVSGK